MYGIFDFPCVLNLNSIFRAIAARKKEKKNFDSSVLMDVDECCRLIGNISKYAIIRFRTHLPLDQLVLMPPCCTVFLHLFS